MDNLPILSYQRQRVYRATFDTNVFVRAVLGTDNVANALISLWLDETFILVLRRWFSLRKSGKQKLTSPDLAPFTSRLFA